MAGYFNQVFVNGLAAPMFLLLAGVALAMAAESRSRAARCSGGRALRQTRGWQVFGLAFLFRVQSQLLGWGPFVNLLKVDILNVMGPAMVAAAWLWRLAGTRTAPRVDVRDRGGRVHVRDAAAPGRRPWLDPVPDPLEWYIRPTPGRTTFTLFPWAGFLMAGALAASCSTPPAPADTSAGCTRRWPGGARWDRWGVRGVVAFRRSMPNAQFWTSRPRSSSFAWASSIAAIPAAWLIALSGGPWSRWGVRRCSSTGFTSRWCTAAWRSC